MNEPWKDNSAAWKAFCREEFTEINNELAEELYKNGRKLKDEFEWFMKGWSACERANFQEQCR